ncbi:SPOR domain-containing protein [Photobacterium sp. S4TG1]|uniref:SPOR domain-containing protein n=1 Tax=Photobacterium sp. S4TG1 TaxID=3114587 RepID=UPI002E19938D|nr:SPOR domain-containing protein [Photobacterium sp. S4TG1]
MKKIITLSLLSSLVGCAQLMPPKTSLQTPIETINTTQSTEKFVEPTVVAELDESVKTDPLYQSIDSIAVSEQVIKEQPAAKAVSITENTSESTAVEETNELAVDTTTDVDAVAVEPAKNTTTDVDAVAAEPTENTATDIDAEATEPAINEVMEMDAASIESAVNAATETDNTAATVTDEPEPIESSNDTTVDDQTVVDDQASANEPIAADDEYKTTVMHGYSVQVTASRDEQSLVKLLSLLDSQQPAWLNKKMINGSQVYTLLLGHYSDHEQAKAALALLPEAVQNNGAFVRNFYEIEHTRSPQLKQLQ